MTEQQEKRVQLAGRMSGWVAVLSVITLAVDAWKHPVYPRGFESALGTLMGALVTITFAFLWAMFRHPGALGRALRPKLFGLFRPLAGLILVAATAVLPWSYFTHRPAFQVLTVFVCLLGAAVIADVIWLFHAHPERLPRRGKPDNKSMSGIG